jgi:GTP-binding protein EngB required for normal cell division
MAAARLARLGEIAGELGADDLASDAHTEQRRLEEARIFVACVGQFKRGKSTLINALVGQSVLPVGVVPVTSVVTILRHADRPGAFVHFADRRTESVAVDDVGAFIDERRNPRNERGATVVEIGLPSPILHSGLCLVDTPGLGSVHTANTMATQAFVPRIDVALIVVGPDPPISGAELELLQEADREAGEMAAILNKADQVSSDHLQEVADFTRTTIVSAIKRRLRPFFVISALERLTVGTPTRDWASLESYLHELSMSARERLVGHAGERAVARLAPRVASELKQREDALRRPRVESDERVARLRQALADVDQALIELRFRFDAAEADLGAQFAQRRARFIESTGHLADTLLEWIEAHATSGRSLRRQAFEEAGQLATSAVQEWFETTDPEANQLYQTMTDRFVRVANDYIARVAADVADLDAEELPADNGFRARREFYFTHLMYTTGGTPVTWLIDRSAPGGMRQAHVARAAAAYLTHLLETNSHRVENAFRDRARESRRWLEGQIRARLASALRSAERAVTVAVDKQHLSEADLNAALHRLQELHSEIMTFTR